jgi:hypothetical protein
MFRLLLALNVLANKYQLFGQQNAQPGETD